MALGFTFNSVHSSVHSVVVKSKKRQILPATTDTYLQISGRHGSYLFPGTLTDHIDELECSVKQNTLIDLRIKSHEIAAWLYTADWAVLSYDDDPGKSCLAKVEGPIDPEQILKMSKFPVNFRCSPLAYGAEVVDNFVTDAVTANNAGNHETLPTFDATFTATATEWKVTLGTKYIRVVHAFAIADTLQVNCDTGAVLINGSRAMDDLDWQNSEFFALAVGNNALAITPTSKCTATVKHTPRFL